MTDNASELWLLSPNQDDLLLTGENEVLGSLFTIAALNDGANWGAPEPIDVAVSRWMADGAVAVTQGHDNREITLTVMVSADTPVDLAAGEASLAVRSGRSCLLKWVPPAGDPDAPACVFAVWTWHLEHNFDGLDERNLQRVYTLTFTAKPYVQSDELTVVPALPSIPVPTVVSIDACSSTSGWSGFPNAPSSSGGNVVETQTVVTTTAGGAYGASLVRVGAVSMGSQPYLSIDFTTSGATFVGIKVYVDTVACTRVATLGTTSYWALPAGVTSFTTLQLTVTYSIPAHRTATPVFSVNDISKTDSPGGIGSHMQLFRNMDVGGSVKTSGSIQIASPSGTGLGTVQVYSRGASAAGYVPAMRRYRTGGGTPTADSTCVSGFRDPIMSGGSPTAIETFSVPANQLREGTYAIVGRFKSTVFPTSINMLLKASTGSGVAQSVTVPVTWGALGGLFSLTTLALMALPTQQLPSESAQATNITLSGIDGAGSGIQYLDELYLYDLTRGDLSIIKAGGYTKLWIDAPDVDTVRNRMAVYLGTAADRSDAVGATADQIQALSVHDFDPDGISLTTTTDGVPDAIVTGSFYRRWHTHAGT